MLIIGMLGSDFRPKRAHLKSLFISIYSVAGQRQGFWKGKGLAFRTSSSAFQQVLSKAF